MDEFDLIQRHFVREHEAGGVTTGIGDDGAVLRLEQGYELVTVVDTVVEGVHFPPEISPGDLAYRAVAVNLSDIAAMGARPRWMTLALTMPAADDDWLREFADGLFEAAAEHGVSLVGGDTTRGPNVVVTVQITGDVAAGKAVLRSGANAGDTIYVTGTIGDAAAGLARMASHDPGDALVRRFLRPTARVEVGQALTEIATAAIDISDGLIGDLQKLLDASNAGAEIDLTAVPVSESLQQSASAEERRRFVLTGGDDYELCFTATTAPAEIDGVPVTAIGVVTAGGQLICRDDTGVVDVEDSGYRHFDD